MKWLHIWYLYRLQIIYTSFASNSSSVWGIQINCIRIWTNVKYQSFPCYNPINCRPLPTVLRSLYFWFSLVFIIFRTTAVSFSMARINDESKKPIDILRSIPSHSWNYSECGRFLNDVINDDIALSGMRFFFITRKFALSVSDLWYQLFRTINKNCLNFSGGWNNHNIRTSFNATRHWLHSVTTLRVLISPISEVFFNCRTMQIVKSLLLPLYFNLFKNFLTRLSNWRNKCHTRNRLILALRLFFLCS